MDVVERYMIITNNLDFKGTNKKRSINSFPTRRSSDLKSCSAAWQCSRGPRRGFSCRAGWGRPRSTGESRSEEHTSELQSPCNLVCRPLLEKKKNSDNFTNKYILITPVNI